VPIFISVGDIVMGSPQKNVFIPVERIEDHRGKTLHLSPALKSIYIYVDEYIDDGKKKSMGSVTFVTVNGKKEYADLARNWFPPGVWEVQFDNQGNSTEYHYYSAPKHIDASKIALIEEKAKTDSFLIASYSSKKQKERILRLLETARNSTIRLYIGYERHSEGNIISLSEKLPLTDDNTSVLADEAIAKIYLQFVEHFGQVKVDYGLANGGLTSQELSVIENNDPKIINITNLFTQGYSEFSAIKDQASPKATLDEFMLMEEAVFFQRKCRNDLALRNMLMIGMGVPMIFENGAWKPGKNKDVGIIRRGGDANKFLLYDRAGRPVRGQLGFQDINYVNINLSKIGIGIEISDDVLFNFLRTFEQTTSYPIRDLGALSVGIFKYLDFIIQEITLRFGEEIATRIIRFAPMVVGWFVIHAVISHFAKTGHPVWVLLAVLAKGAGLIMGVDFGLSLVNRLVEAGSHFAMMETIARKDPNNPQLEKLSSLSEFHLKKNAEALLDAMADIIALGVIAKGLKGSISISNVLKKGLSNPNPKIELTVEGDQAVKIKSLEEKTSIEAPKDINKESIIGSKAPEKATGNPETVDAYGGKEELKSKLPKRGWKTNLDLEHIKFSQSVSAKIKQHQLAQKTNNIDALYKQAEIAHIELKKLTDNIAQSTNGKPVVPEKLKSMERARDKIAIEFEGDASKLFDISRSTIVYDSISDLYLGLQKIDSSVEVVRIKDRFVKPTSVGYRDILLNIRQPNGHITELQLAISEILEVKDGEGHKLYEQIRKIIDLAKAENREYSQQEIIDMDNYKLMSEKMYNEAFYKALNK
jgi:hypothetical protein